MNVFIKRKKHIGGGRNGIAFRAVLLILALMISLPFACQTAYAAEADSSGSYAKQDIIHVGFFHNAGYHNMDGSGEKSGYGYDFLQMISGYANFRYIYVGYQKNWDDMLKMLENGKIDMLTYALKTADNKKHFDFSRYSIGTSSALLTTSISNRKFAANDNTPFNGMRVGLLKDGGREKAFASYAAEKGITYKPVYFSSMESMKAALKKGNKIDAMVSEELRTMSDEIIIDEFAPRSMYVIVKKGNTSLLNRINESIKKLNTADPGWMTELQNKYLLSEYSTGLTTTLSEANYIKKLKARGSVLQVLFNPGRYPLSYYENGKAKGVLVDIFKNIAAGYGIKYKFIKADSIDDYYKLREKGKADVVLDFSESADEAEVLGYRLTASYEDSNCSVITTNDFNGTINTAAVIKGSEDFTEIAKENNEQAKIIYYDTFSDCVDAVKKEKADCTYTYSLTAQMFAIEDSKDKIKVAQLNGDDFHFRMAVNAKVDMVMYSMLNKAAHAVNASKTEKIVDSYILSAKQNYNLWDYLTAKPLLIAGIILIILAVMVIFLFVQKNNARKLKASNDALEAAVEAANSANTAKTRFLSQMSHDIRTPLNGIIGMAQIASENIDDRECIADSVDKINQSSEHLLTLINDILDLSRIESGKVTMAHEPTDIRTTVNQCIDVLNSSVIGRDIEIVTDIEDTEHPYVLTDSLHIRQILINIISNAVKFTPDGGRITFKADWRTAPDGRTLYGRFEISDTGIGMDKDFLKDIFKAFVQADSHNARTQYKGSGLGMSIVKQYVDMLGGKIDIQSETGKGTAVAIELPLEIVQNEADYKENTFVQIRHEQVDFTGAVVLLVEDNEINMKIAQTMLEKRGIIVDTAKNGEEAVEKFRESAEGKYDCILMDIMMPVMDGYEATKIIRALERADAESVPIIAMSAKAFSEDVGEALAAGMSAHIAKPIDRDAAMNVLAKFIHSQGT